MCLRLLTPRMRLRAPPSSDLRHEVDALRANYHAVTCRDLRADSARKRCSVRRRSGSHSKRDRGPRSVRRCTPPPGTCDVRRATRGQKGRTARGVTCGVGFCCFVLEVRCTSQVFPSSSARPRDGRTNEISFKPAQALAEFSDDDDDDDVTWD